MNRNYCNDSLRTAIGIFLLPFLCAAGCSYSADRLQSATIGGHARQWLVHVPPGYEPGHPLPLVIAFHGHGGSPSGMARLSGLDRVADKKSFIVVYPAGFERSWAADTNTEADRASIDDVAFTATLLDRLEKDYAIDTSHVVATGFSNGAHMVQLLGCRLADRIRAIVPVSGTLAPAAATNCRPARALTMIEFHGTADPIDPFDGGKIGIRGGGDVLGVAQNIADWATWDRCESAAVTKSALAPDAAAPALAIRDFPGCADKVRVVLYEIANGGHTWPGGPQYLPERIIGKATQVVDASRVIGEIATGTMPATR